MGLSVGSIIAGLGGGQPSVWGEGLPTGGSGSSSGGIFGGSTLQNILTAVGLGSSVLGSILNRPKGLSSQQKKILDQLTATLSAKATGPVAVDPTMRNALYEQIAGSAQGARNRLQNDFAGRGLTQSGLLPEELGRVERTAQSAQTAGTLDLLKQAKGEQQNAQGQLQSLLLGIPSTQGASAAGVGLSSVGEVLGYLLTLQTLGRH